MYGTQYILAFTNDLEEFYEIYFDTLDYAGPVTQLIGTDDVLTLQSTSGDEDRLQPILGMEALINIFVDENTDIDITDFIAEQDNQIRVTVYRERDYTTNVFQGFVVVEDNFQPFLDPPFAISLRALDGLGLLKGVDLTDTNDLLFAGNFSVIAWIVQILYKTGQTLNLRVFFNFWEASFSTTINPLEQTYLDSITFSQGDAFNATPTDPTVDIAAQDADDCYTALEKIVRCFRCRLFQEDGRWNLVNIAEYYNPAGMSYTEYSIGDPVAGIVPFSPVTTGQLFGFAQAGKNEIVHPVTDDQAIYLKIATKWVKLTYTYNQSQNKVCNQDFSEGDRNATYDEVISSSILDTSITPVVNLQTHGYDIYCWTHRNGSINGGTGVSNAFPDGNPDSDAFIRSVLDQLGYEKERYAVIKNSPSGKPAYIKTMSFLIDASDALVINLTTRSRNSHTTGLLIPFAWVYLTGDDGSHWALNGIEGPSVTDPEGNKATWQAVDSNFLNGFGNSPDVGWRDTNQAPNIWFTVASGQYKPAITPVSGRIQIFLINWLPDETWHKDLQVQVTPFLQGSYTQLQGDYNYSSSNNAIKQTEADDVEISDSPKRYFKGALLKANGDLLTPVWKPLGGQTGYRFTQIMEMIMYTALYRMVQKIEGTFRGVIYQDNQDATVTRPNGYLNSWNFSDAPEPTKKFMLTSFKKDFGTAQWRGVWVETLRDQNDTGLATPDVYQFSYIFNSTT